MRNLEYLETGVDDPSHLLLMLHGYGSNAEDLLDLAPEIASALPTAKIISVQAPQLFEQGGENAWQWFSLIDYNESSLLAGVTQAGEIFADFTTQQQQRFGLPRHKIAVLGFSQGGMVAMHAAYRLVGALGGVLIYSSAMIAPRNLKKEVRSKPPTMLIHGREDNVIPASNMLLTAQTLQSLAVPVKHLLRPHLGHGLDKFGLDAGCSFLKQYLS